MEQLVPNGLNVEPLEAISDRIVAMGFNCVRLPFSLDMVFQNRTRVPEAAASLAANPRLQELSPLGLFDETVAALTKVGLLVILNNHVSVSQWCCDEHDSEQFWYTDEYPETTWLNGLAMMAARYRNNARVCGFDLRNEVRPSSTRVPTWGGGDPATDWSMAAIKGGQRVLKENPEMLIVVSGMHYCQFLCEVPSLPIHVSIPEFRGKIVYTAHEYPWFNHHLKFRTLMEKYTLTIGLAYVSLCVLVFCNQLYSRCRSRCRFKQATVEQSPVEVIPGSIVDLNDDINEDMPKKDAAERLAQSGKVVADQAVEQARLEEGINSEKTPKTNAWGKAEVAIPDAETSQQGCLESLQQHQRAATVAVTCGIGCIGFAVLGDHMFGICSMSNMPAAMICLSLAVVSGILCLVLSLRLALMCARTLDRHFIRNSNRTRIPPDGRLGTEQPAGIVPETTVGADRACKVLRSTCWRWCFSSNCAFVAYLQFFVVSAFILYTSFGTYERFEFELDRRWGFLHDSSEVEPAPVWLGEFGTAENNLWWRYMMRYMQEREIDWAYWSLNGQKRTNESESYGIFDDDSKTIRHQWKLNDLQALMK